MALSLTATFRTANGRAAYLAARQPITWRAVYSATATARVQLVSGLSGVQQAQPLVPDLRLQIRALSCSAIIGDRVPGDKGASASDTPVSDTPVSDTPVSDTPVSDTPVSATPVSDPNGNQLAQGQKWTRSYEKHAKGVSYPKLKKWYIDAIAQFKIPTIKNLVQLLTRAQKQGDHEFLETVVCKDFPKLLGGLKRTGLDKTDRLFKYYKSSVWSCAISSHVSRKEVDKAMEYFGRIIDAGTFPASDDCAALLKSLEAKGVPFPVLPMKLNKTASTICGMKPAYPPRSESSDSKFIKVESPAHRQTLVAQMGFSMLYSLLQHKQWPTDYFYHTLLGLLARAQMTDKLQYVFKVVMPVAKRNVPGDIKSPHRFETGPLAWATAIQAMSNSGKFDLAKKWFDKYRAEVVPKLREESSSFAKQWSKFSEPSRFALLASPYYAAAQIVRYRTSDDTSIPWYNLKQVEQLLELDQLREQDKLTRPFTGSVQMLQVFTGVDEHFSMDQAEALIKDVGVPYPVTKKLRYIRPDSYTKLAMCYKMMVDGYLTMSLKQKEQLGKAYKTDSGAMETKERIKFWFEKLQPVRAKALKESSKDDSRITFDKKRLAIIHRTLELAK
ncbi:hypothetical protein GGH12_000979 [Coemansia sp. RSA 1822]|nr:hypothetical protein GGF49_002392 [Coemansia sp. RSA 1853]KAJ2566249.1 hypothetical protein GGH12_000979 [Coemansia sp. RSA 1822]